ncbi:hypothetical protein BJY52DRAFT_1185411 [Lactarius psammicola]|nr:hypothetical protein BJY52DRAFT_1185411 [Lactarius psammicola]
MKKRRDDGGEPVLSSCAVARLRALVVLPTRDLVVQVRETFEAIAKGRGLKIGSVTRQHSYSHEQAELVNKGPTCVLARLATAYRQTTDPE